MYVLNVAAPMAVPIVPPDGVCNHWKVKGDCPEGATENVAVCVAKMERLCGFDVIDEPTSTVAALEGTLPAALPIVAV